MSSNDRLFHQRRGSGRRQPADNEGRFSRFNNSRNHREVVVKVPEKSCGLIVGTKGRNIKELQRTEGIRYINVDFKAATVKIVGTEEGIRAAQRRIDQAVCIAVNSTSYFPEMTITILHLSDGFSGVRFDSLERHAANSATLGGVRLEQLDAHRHYSVINTVRDSELGDQPLCYGDTEKVSKDSIIVGRSRDVVMPFVEDVVRKNLDAMLEPFACPEIGVSFGKTFLSSIPNGATKRVLSPGDVNTLEYGKRGIRPEFVRHLDPQCREAFLDAVLDSGYVPMESGRWAVIHCISQRAKKRYRIKFKHGDKKVEADAASKAMRQVAEAQSYYEVLGIVQSDSLTSREVDIAFQRQMLAVSPDNNSHPQAGEAMAMLNEARKALRDDEARSVYNKLPPSLQLPRNRFVYAAEAPSEPLPDVHRLRSKVRRLALVTVLRDALESEYRTTIEIEKDEVSLDPTMRQKLQKAWDERTEDGKFRFPGGTDDWLIIDTTRYKERESYTNGSFTLTIDTMEEEHFGKTMEGINISLKSEDVIDSLAWLAGADDDLNREPQIVNLVQSLENLQDEAARLSSFLDQVFQSQAF